MGLDSKRSREIRTAFYNGRVYHCCCLRKKANPRLGFFRLFLSGLIISAQCLLAWAQAAPQTTAVSKIQEPCPREAAGTTIAEPRDRRSKNGSLKLTLTIRSSTNPNWRWSDSSPPASKWSRSDWAGG